VVAAGSCTFFGLVAAIIPRPSRRRSGVAALRPLLPPDAAVVRRVRGASSSFPFEGLVDLNFLVPKAAASSSSRTE